MDQSQSMSASKDKLRQKLTLKHAAAAVATVAAAASEAKRFKVPHSTLCDPRYRDFVWVLQNPLFSILVMYVLLNYKPSSI